MTTRLPLVSLLGVLALVALGGCAAPAERARAQARMVSSPDAPYDEQRLRQAVRMLPVIEAGRASARMPVQLKP